MLHKGARTTGGNIPGDVGTKIGDLLDQFVEIVATNVAAAKIRRAIVRSMLTCSTLHIIDKRHVFVAAQKHTGMASTISLDLRDKDLSPQEVFDAARWEFGFDDPFVLQFPAILLDGSNETRAAALEAIAQTYIKSELHRIERQMNVIQINPLFGPASYSVDPRLAFVLMPFTDELTEIYNTFVKPTIEDERFGLVCRRADDIKSNKAIIQDIWKSVCEARLIVADLSTLNPNVMYELGIAHTLGKETVLIYQCGDDVKFPFDLTHIRRIEYNNDAVGGKRLVDELTQTIEAILEPTVTPST